MSLDVENKIRDIQERYRTLAMYDIKVCISYLYWPNIEETYRTKLKAAKNFQMLDISITFFNIGGSSCCQEFLLQNKIFKKVFLKMCAVACALLKVK